MRQSHSGLGLGYKTTLDFERIFVEEFLLQRFSSSRIKLQEQKIDQHVSTYVSLFLHDTLSGYIMTPEISIL